MLAGRNAVVTGGASGIGLAVAMALVADGARVLIGGRSASKLDEVTEWGGTSLIGQTVDVADRQSVAEFFERARRDLGQIDILVHAAGVNIPNRSMDAMRPEQWDEVMAINATGPYNCLREVLPEMKGRREGTVILISSVTGKRALALGGVAYCASKFAMTALGTCVANECLEAGVRVTNVYPGEVDTPILEQRPTPITAEHRARILRPEDVASMILSIIRLPARVHIPEIVIKPITQSWF